jgi:hypothetical protein
VQRAPACDLESRVAGLLNPVHGRTMAAPAKVIPETSRYVGMSGLVHALVSDAHGTRGECGGCACLQHRLH